MAPALPAVLAAAVAAVGVLLAAPARTAACSCAGPPTLLGSYFRPNTATVVIATPQTLEVDNGRERVYALTGGYYPVNTTVYKGCPTRLARFRTFGSLSSCSTSFALGVPVLLMVSKSGFVGPCDYTVRAASLTAGDVAFLTRRSGCGSCVTDNEVHCFVAPCQVSKPCGPDAAKCVDNYCGGCFAEWFKADGTPLVCSPGGGGGGWSGPSPVTPTLSRAPPPSPQGRIGYGLKRPATA